MRSQNLQVSSVYFFVGKTMSLEVTRTSQVPGTMQQAFAEVPKDIFKRPVTSSKERGILGEIETSVAKKKMSKKKLSPNMTLNIVRCALRH